MPRPNPASSTKTPSIGTNSNLGGMAVEREIQAALERQGWKAQTRYLLQKEEGGNLYGTDALVSAFAHRCRKFPHGLAVDATCQNSPGTAYQKVCFKVLSAAKTWKVPSILVIDGMGRPMPQARAWAKAWHARNTEKYPHFLGVFTMAQFKAWCELEGQQSAQIYIPQRPRVLQEKIPGLH